MDKLDVLMLILNGIMLFLCGGAVGWLLGYRAGFRRATKLSEGKPDVYIPGLRDLAASRHIEYWCPECGAPLSNHCSGCPYDTEANRALSRG